MTRAPGAGVGSGSRRRGTRLGATTVTNPAAEQPEERAEGEQEDNEFDRTADDGDPRESGDDGDADQERDVFLGNGGLACCRCRRRMRKRPTRCRSLTATTRPRRRSTSGSWTDPTARKGTRPTARWRSWSAVPKGSARWHPEVGGRGWPERRALAQRRRAGPSGERRRGRRGDGVAHGTRTHRHPARRRLRPDGPVDDFRVLPAPSRAA